MSEEALIRGVRQQIVSRLRDDILSGRLAEGTHLSEAHLAERFRVSRGPIREALVQLGQEGLLVAKPNCGVRVAASAPDSIRDLITPLRRVVETYALRLVFADLGAADFATWQAILDRMKVAGRQKDTAAAVEQDIAFHRFLVERAEQPDLLAIWSTMIARIRRHFQHVHTLRPIDVYANHRALFDALRNDNQEQAIQALEEHID